MFAVSVMPLLATSVKFVGRKVLSACSAACQESKLWVQVLHKIRAQALRAAYLVQAPVDTATA